MRKIYLSAVCIALLFSFSSSSDAQTYTTTTTGGTRLVSDPATWVGGIAGTPPFNCTGCTINFIGQVFVDLGVTFTNCTINVFPNAAPATVLEIDEFTELINTVVTVGNNTTVTVNDEVHLYGTSNIRLANSNAVVNTANGIANPSDGTLGPGLAEAAGIYFILQAAPPVVNNSTTYDIVLNGQFGYGGQFIAKAVPPNSNFPTPLSANTGLGDSYPYCGSCFTGEIIGPVDIESATLTTLAIPGVGSSMQFVQIAPLPITLSKFAASLNANNTTNVSWTTSLEINSDYFVVERSSDRSNWTSLAQIKAKGHSAGNVDYTYTDQSPLNGTSYYRLQMVDIDSKYKYSKVAAVTLDGNTVPLVVYNNPFHDQIRIKINVAAAAKLDLTLTDMLGRTFTHQSVNAQAGDNFVNIAPAGITEGVYILNINGQNYHQTSKLIKQ